jgi:cadmium resistance protein CadD (predicted permease)
VNPPKGEQLVKAFLAKGPVLAALAIFAVLVIASVFITAHSYTLPKPADWLEAWFKLFQSVVTIVVGLKIAANFDSVVSALAGRARNPGSGDRV